MRYRRPQSGALQLIFSIFLGVMLVTFVGIGVWTFYPMPDAGQDSEVRQQIRTLESEREGIWRVVSEAGDTPTAAQDARIAEIDTELSGLYQQEQLPQTDWRRNTSIILIVFATVAMAVSLTQSDALRVLSNGFLLGGIFSMVYGMGWAIASESSYTRFGVVTVALIITVALGYTRFVRAKRESSQAEIAAVAASAGPDAELVARIMGLERRVEAMADVLGSDRR